MHVHLSFEGVHSVLFRSHTGSMWHGLGKGSAENRGMVGKNQAVSSLVRPRHRWEIILI